MHGSQWRKLHHDQKRPSGAKALVDLVAVPARLKSCPFKTTLEATLSAARKTMPLQNSALATQSSGSHGEEVADHLAAAFGKHALGMKLHALNGQSAVAQPHDHGSAHAWLSD